MAQTLTIPQIDVQSDKLTITDEQVLIDGESHGTTPLADVDAETSADTILGVKDGAVVQLEPDDLKDDLGIDALESRLSIAYEDHTFYFSDSVSITSVGARVEQLNYTPSHTPLFSAIISVAASNKYNPMTFIYNGAVYLNYYAALSSGSISVAESNVVVRTFYAQ